MDLREVTEIVSKKRKLQQREDGGLLPEQDWPSYQHRATTPLALQGSRAQDFSIATSRPQQQYRGPSQPLRQPDSSGSTPVLSPEQTRKMRNNVRSVRQSKQNRQNNTAKIRDQRDRKPEPRISSRTAFGRDKDLGQNPEREPEPRRRRGGYDSDDSMDMDPPPVEPPYDRDYDRRDRDREPKPRRGDRHGRDTRDTREIDPRQIPDPRYQDLHVPESRGQDPRYQQDTRDIRDPRDPRDPRIMRDPRLQDPRILANPRYPDPRYQDSRDIPVTSARHQPYVTTLYQEPPSILGYTLSPSAQPAGYDYNLAQPRGYSNNTPPPATTRGGQSMYVQPGYPAVAQGPQLTMLDPRTGRLSAQKTEQERYIHSGLSPRTYLTSIDEIFSQYFTTDKFSDLDIVSKSSARSSAKTKKNLLFCDSVGISFHHTISEDRSGSQEAIMRQRLAALTGTC